MENPTSFPTGIHDIDREILYNVSDKELFSACLSSKYMQEVCNESFWMNKFIIEFGTDLGKCADKPYKNLYKKLKPLNNEKLLTSSSKRGYLSLIKLLIEDPWRGTDIHVFDDKALRNAAFNGHLDVVKYLIKNGANIHANYDESIRFAAKNNHLDVVKYLIKHGADIHAYRDEALRYAANNGHLNVVKYLVEGPWNENLQPLVPWESANIHVYNDYALRKSALNGYLDVVKYLIEKGANINVLDDYVTRYAARNNHLDVVKYLTEDINILNSNIKK
jgi:ankyrin repeat protein